MNMFIFNLLLCFHTLGGGNALAVSSIPQELLPNANAVVRYDITRYHILKIDEMEMLKDVAMTVLNEKSQSLGHVYVHYQDKVDQIKDLEIEVLNAAGESIKVVKKKEISDISLSDGFSIAGDSRAKVFRYTSNMYPYTIKYSYTKKSENTLALMPWFPIGSMNVSVQESRYTIENSVPDMVVKSYVHIDTKEGFELDTVAHSYFATNVPAARSEDKSPKASEWLPHIRFLPSHFYFHGHSGSFEDWSGYGQWMYDNMLAGRGSLPDGLLAEVDPLVAGASSPEEIARILYDYVTRSTRYVSVQLGIGGFKPFACEDVYDLKYGDCKALSYYLHNLLHHYNVESIYTEIEADRSHNVDYDPVRPGLDQGNHIVICLPMVGDTTWLECTSQHTLFGYTHSGINDRKALMISPEGGKLARTTRYSAEDNLSVVDATIDIGEASHVVMNLVGHHSKQRHEAYLGILLAQEGERIRRISHAYSRLSKIDIRSYDLQLDSVSHTAVEKAQIGISAYVEKAGPYMMVPIDIGKIVVPKQLDLRRIHNIYIKDGSMDRHFIEIAIPHGYVPLLEDLQSISFANDFGEVGFKIQRTADKVGVNINVTTYAGTYDSSKVGAFNEFVDTISRTLSQKVVLKPIK